jgi:hypothetical protein
MNNLIIGFNIIVIYIMNAYNIRKLSNNILSLVYLILTISENYTINGNQ